LSHFRTRALANDFAAGQQTARLSLDLGQSTVQVALTPASAVLPGECLITWATVQEIDEAANNCFAYAELFRVLRRRGRLFHYIGNPASPSGKSVTQGVVRRLKEADFTCVEPAPRAFGVVAAK
jgi:hypothetical protein